MGADFNLRDMEHEWQQYEASLGKPEQPVPERRQSKVKDDLELEFRLHETDSALRHFGDSIKPGESIESAEARLRTITDEYAQDMEIYFRKEEEQRLQEIKEHLLAEKQRREGLERNTSGSNYKLDLYSNSTDLSPEERLNLGKTILGAKS